jgi:hypothetical protein
MKQFKVGDIVRYYRSPSPVASLTGSVWVVTDVYGVDSVTGLQKLHIEPLFGDTGPWAFRNTSSNWVEKINDTIPEA